MNDELEKAVALYEAELLEVLELARNDLSDWITSFPEAAHANTRTVIARIDAAIRKAGRRDIGEQRDRTVSPPPARSLTGYQPRSGGSTNPPGDE